MLARLATEFCELFDALVLWRLHPGDIMSLSACSVGMRALRWHPACVHVRAFTSTLRAVAHMRYRISRRCEYMPCDIFERGYYIKCDSDLISQRDNVEYSSTLDDCTEELTVQRYNFDSRICDVTFIDHQYDGITVERESLDCHISELWRIGFVTLWHLLWYRYNPIYMRVVGALCRRDVSALACTCTRMRKNEACAQY